MLCLSMVLLDQKKLCVCERERAPCLVRKNTANEQILDSGTD